MYGSPEDFIVATHYEDIGQAALFSKMTYLKRGTLTKLYISTAEVISFQKTDAFEVLMLQILS
jgi:hypothetical protein